MTPVTSPVYYCKLVFADKVEPTVDFTGATAEELKMKLQALIERFMADPSIDGVYLGKRCEEARS
jgi:hypothetical protein